MLKKHRAWLALVLFAAVGFGLYADVIVNGVFLFDDFEYVVGNPIIQDASKLDLSDPRQVGYLTFALNYAIGGDDPVGFHLVNVAIHVLNGLLVFLLVRMLLRILAGPQRVERDDRADATALLAAVLFLVHPMATMAVSYISQRFTSLATLFYLLSVLGYLAARARAEAGIAGRPVLLLTGASLACTLVAMRTKEIAFTIPFALAAFELLLFGGSPLGRRRFLRLIPYAVLMLIIPLAIFGPNLGILSQGEGIAEVTRVNKIYDLTERSPWHYLLTQLRVVATYIRLLLLPVDQRVVYDFKVSRSLFDPWVLLSAAFLASIMAAAVLAWRRAAAAPAERAPYQKLTALGILWFFLTLSVESSIIPIKDVIFEHRTYLPGVGWHTALAALLVSGAYAVRTPLRPAVLTGVMTAVLAAALGTATVVRNVIWTDELAFWDDCVRKNPQKAIGYHNRGNAYAKLGQYGEALDDMNWVIASFPKNPLAALSSFEIADYTVDNMAKTYMNRASVYLNLGLKQLADADMKRAKDLISRAPIDTDSTRRLADRYASQGAYRYAIEEYSKVLDWDPTDISALIDRANAYSLTGNTTDAVRDLSRIILLDPENTLALHNRGIAYAWSDRTDKALEDLRRACGLGYEPSCDGIEVLQRKRQGGSPPGAARLPGR